MRRLACALVLAAALHAPAARAQAADIAPPDGAQVTHDETADLDSYALPVTSFAEPVPTILLSGQVTRRAWRISAAERTVTSMAAGFRRAVEEQGYRRLLDCAGAACGGFDFRFGASVIAPPAMAMDVRDFAQITAGREAPAAYVSILVSQVRDAIYVQIVTVVPEDPGLPLVAEPLEPLSDIGSGPAEEAGAGGEEAVRALEPAPADGGAAEPPRTRGGRTTHADDVPDDGRPLLDRLLEYGHVPVAGLAFATGGAELTGDSAPALDEMARMLIDNPDLDVAIVGHSDNVGPLNVNIELSRRRADAVRTALIERGVRSDRLEARGVGYLAPRRSNATEEGRALNRRVELVLR